MIYRPLGNTGLKVSQLGFGAMRLPMLGQGDDARIDRDKSTPMIHRAFAAGLNYIDTAVGYCNQDSQRAVGDALRAWGRRDSIIVSTKNHDYGDDEKKWWTNLENSLERIGVEYLDVYHHHGVNRNSFDTAVLPRVGKWMQKAKDQGLVRHIACSFHDNAEALMHIIDSGYPEVLTVQYNMLDRSLEAAIAHAHERGIGVVVMGPVAGGRLGVDSDVLANLVPGVKRVPELAVRFVLANPNVSLALSGMATMEMVEENLATCSDSTALSEPDKAAIDQHLIRLKQLSDLYCTGCGYCKPCEQGVDIPGVFTRYNQARVYGLWDHARAAYKQLLDKGIGGDQCIQCGDCEPKCPQNLHIQDELEKAHQALNSK